jgi:hypothetical protein
MELLKTGVALLLMLTPLTPQVSSQSRCRKHVSADHRVSDTMTPYIGGHKLYDVHVEGYENLLALWVDIKSPKGYQGDYKELLIPDENGVIPIAGRLVFKGDTSKYQSYEFKTAALIEKYGKPVHLTFTTVTVKDVSYIFNGYYIKIPTQKSATSDVYIEGVIKQYTNGIQSSATTLRFIPFSIIE